jgi:hypothetical protein
MKSLCNFPSYRGDIDNCGSLALTIQIKKERKYAIPYK